MDPFSNEDEEDLIDPQDKTWVFHTKSETVIRRKTFAGFSAPVSFRWFVSVVGTEYCHTYFWIAKDLAWMQGHRDFSIFFGLCALGWSLMVLYHALRTVNWHEIWNFIALFLWLFANFIWMRGEAHDHEYPEEAPIAVESTDISALILSVAFVWLFVYYVVLLPLNVIISSKASLLEYDDGQMRPRCMVFKNFRQYENLHMLFWISKDLAWNRSSLFWWLIFLFPTLFISADLFVIALTSNSADYTLDVVHFGVTLLWVVANSVWGFGDFFIEKYNEPLGIWDNSEETLMTARWYAAWILFFNVCIVFLMYGLWLTLTLTGRLVHTNDGADLSAHKHSMTGLNLSGGNGLLVYENESTTNNNSSATNNSNKYYSSSVTQRYVTNNNNNNNNTNNNANNASTPNNGTGNTTYAVTSTSGNNSNNGSPGSSNIQVNALHASNSYNGFAMGVELSELEPPV